MEKKPLTARKNPTISHLKRLARYLQQRPKTGDFKIYDWLNTIAVDDLVRMHIDLNSISESFITHTRPTKPARELVKAACLAYGAETPGVEPEQVIVNLGSLLQGMNDALHITILARRGWVIVTERVSIWPHSQKPYQVSQRGRIEGEREDDPYTRALLGLASKPRRRGELVR